MAFTVGATYDLASTLKLKSKEELQCVDLFVSSDVLLLLSLLETIPLQYGKICAYVEIFYSLVSNFNILINHRYSWDIIKM